MAIFTIHHGFDAEGSRGQVGIVPPPDADAAGNVIGALCLEGNYDCYDIRRDERVFEITISSTDQLSVERFTTQTGGILTRLGHTVAAGEVALLRQGEELSSRIFPAEEKASAPPRNWLSPLRGLVRAVRTRRR